MLNWYNKLGNEDQSQQLFQQKDHKTLSWRRFLSFWKVNTMDVMEVIFNYGNNYEIKMGVYKYLRNRVLNRINLHS